MSETDNEEEGTLFAMGAVVEDRPKDIDREDQEDPLNIDPQDRKLVTQPYDYSLESISQRVNRGKIILDIDYQRTYIWDDGKASRLIESFLMNVPIPVCYFAETEGAEHEVIDGLQRITAINRFLNDEFPLRGISVLTEFAGKKFTQLPPRTQNQLENRTIRCIVITTESHPDIKFDVFERLNTGSVQLSSQELRNCVYRGNFNGKLKEVATDERFRRILGNGRNARMNFEELALRFFAFKKTLPSYRPPLRQMLNTYMRENRQGAPSEGELGNLFQTCDLVWEIFGNQAFFVMDTDGHISNNLNKALFDSLMLPLSVVNFGSALEKKEEIFALKSRLFQDPDFVRSIGRATADRSRVNARIGKVQEGLTDLGLNVPLQLPEAEIRA